MGWSSAVGIFDSAVDVTLKFLPKTKQTNGTFGVDNILVAAVVEEMYRGVEWEDWDTQLESEYAEYLVPILYADGRMDENEYNWRMAGCPDDWDW